MIYNSGFQFYLHIVLTWGTFKKYLFPLKPIKAEFLRAEIGISSQVIVMYNQH